MTNPDDLANYIMAKLMDATADENGEYTKKCLNELKKLCDKEIVKIMEVEQDMKDNPQFYA